MGKGILLHITKTAKGRWDCRDHDHCAAKREKKKII